MADFLLGGQIDAATHERTGTTTTVNSGDLTTHGVIVGMTGSGKTGLGIVLIEEALQAGMPTLLIDPKGDLTNLCLTFPALAPADFGPWVNEGDAKEAGQTVPRVRRRAGRRRGRRARPAGGSARPTIAALRDAARRSRSTRRARSAASDSTSSARCRRRPTWATSRSSATRSKGSSADCSASSASTPIRCRAASTSCCRNLILHEWSAGRSLDLPTLVGMVADAADPQARRVRARRVLPAEGPHRVRDAAQRPARLAVVRGVGERARRSTSSRCCAPPDGRPRCAIVTTAHLSDEERQFVTTLVLSKLVTWMRAPERHHRPAGAALHGRGRRLPAADRRCRRRRSRS